MADRQETSRAVGRDRRKNRTGNAEERRVSPRERHQDCRRRLREAREILTQVPGGLVLLQEGKIAYANGTVKAQLGVEDAGILGRHFLEFVHPDSVEFVRSMHRQRTSGKAVPRVYETYLMAKDGRAVCCEVRVKRIRYRGRRAFLVSLLGVGQRRRRERQLIRSQKMETVSRMASGLAQELDRCLQSLEAVPPPGDAPLPASIEDVREWLQQVDRARQEARSIAGQLCVLGKDVAERPRGPAVDLKKVVRESVADVRNRLRDDGIHLRTYLRDLPPVRGQAREVRNAVTHIIRNAVDALPGAGEIYVTTEMASGFAQVYIQDNGDGIPEAMLDRIFDPFFTTREGTRLGLGLSLARAVIYQNGGEIEVLNHKERGTTFVIRFPVAQSSSAARARTQSTKKKIADAQFLILPDEGIVHDLLMRWLTEKGAAVHSAAGEGEGMHLLHRNRYDMVFLINDVPHIRPAGTAHRIKELRPDLPVAVVGGRQKGPNGVADLVFGAPFFMERVLHTVQETLSGKASKR